MNAGRALGLLATILLPFAAAGGEPSRGGPAPFVVALDDPSLPLNAAAARIYREAFRRLEIPLELVEYSIARRSALVEDGLVDAEGSRVRAYGDAHPRLVRVEEPLLELSFALFTASPAIRLARLEDLAGTAYRVELRRGILMCEQALRRLVPPERLSDVAETLQGVRKLVADRTDLYCEIDEWYVQHVARLPEFRGSRPVRRVLRFATLPTYPFLAERHAALAPRLAAVLRQLRAEGLIDAWVREARAREEAP